MKQNLFGNAAPKNRSIDVGANLLGEWIAEQAKLRREIARFGAILGVAVLVSAATVPTLWESGTHAAADAVKLKAGIKQLDAQLAITDKARQEAQPKLVVDAMCDRTRNSFDFLIAQTERVMRSANPHMVLSGLRSDVTAAEVRVTAQGFAEDEDSADAFTRKVGDPASKADAITNSRPSSLLAPNGLSFEYMKRIEVPH